MRIDQLARNKGYYEQLLTKQVFLAPSKRLSLTRLAEELGLGYFDRTSPLDYEQHYVLPKIGEITREGIIHSYFNKTKQLFCMVTSPSEAVVDSIDRQLIKLVIGAIIDNPATEATEDSEERLTFVDQLSELASEVELTTDNHYRLQASLIIDGATGCLLGNIDEAIDEAIDKLVGKYSCETCDSLSCDCDICFCVAEGQCKLSDNL